MNLVVDYGNSAAKVGIFNHEILEQSLTFSTLDGLLQFVRQSNADNILVSSVKEDPNLILSQATAIKKFVLTPEIALPIQNKYSTPKTLGMDRIASACGA